MAEQDDDDTGEAAPRKDAGDDDEGLLRRLKRWEKLARKHWSSWRDEARLCYDFVAGHQWSAEDKTELISQMRQPVTFNRIAPMVDAVTGAEILNRQEVRYMPREQGDVQVNEIITAADEWARELADTEDEESDAFADTVICGMGWSETRMDYSEDPEGRIIDDRIDPFEMWSDPNARKRCLADAHYLIRGRWRDKTDLPKKWRDKLPSGNEEKPGLEEPDKGWTGPRDDYERPRDQGANEGGESQASKRRVWIRHIQWYDKEQAYRVADPTSGQMITVDKQRLKMMGQMFLGQGQRPPQAVKIEQSKYYEAFIAGNVMLETGPIEANSFTFKCITGKRDRNTNTFYGVVRAMIDPQMWGNKFFVQIMHILNTSAKGGLLYEEDSFKDPRKALEDWSKPDAAIELKRGALAGPNPKVKERTPQVFPAGTEKMMEFALGNMPQTSGINLEMLGLVEREQAGVLENTRKKAGYAILAVFFDSLRRYRKMKGRLRLYFIQNYISDGRLIRIKGKDSTQRYVPLVRQKDTATYDVIVDDAPMSPNQKEAVWGMMVQMMPMLSKLNVPPQVWSIMLEYSPLPSSVSGKINQVLTQQAQQPPPPDPEMVKAQAQLEADKQQAALDAQSQQQTMQMEQEQARQGAALDLQKSQAELVIKREEHEMEMRKLEQQLLVDREKASLDLQAKQAGIALEREKAQLGLQAEGVKHAQSLEFERERHGMEVKSAKDLAEVKKAGTDEPKKPRKMVATVKRNAEGRLESLEIA
jgi:hypothetical protein